MAVAVNEGTIQRLKRVFDLEEIDKFGEQLYELGTEDFTEEWPQSGERIRGRDNAKAINDNYQKSTGARPKAHLRRVTGEGSHYVLEGTIDYGDGTPVSYVGIVELRDGKVAHMTEYFANPFEAPAWRSKWVEKMR